MQRGSFSRTDLIDGHGKAVVTLDRRAGLARPTNQRIALGAVRFVVLDKARVVNRFEVFKPCNAGLHTFFSVCHSPSCGSLQCI